MPFVLSRQIDRVVKIPSLSAHADDRFQIEWQLVSCASSTFSLVIVRLCFDERIETSHVFYLRISIQEESGVVGVCEATRV